MKAVIAILPGDGIGPEVVREGVRVIEAVASRFGHVFDLQEGRIGGAALDKDGVALPEASLALCRKSAAVLLGAVGGPKWDKPVKLADGTMRQRPEAGLLGLRRGLQLFANLRPVAVMDALVHTSPLRPELLRGLDLLVVRELTGGIYFGEKKRTETQASDLCVYTTEEIERVVRVAATQARSRRKKLTQVDKANVLETSRLWREVTDRVMKSEFSDVTLEHMLVDAAAMHLLRRPRDFDVIVTENMFGDILTDEASMLAGSMGLLPSASLGAGTLGLYEPIHGSAPDIAGQGIANPYATIVSVALLLRYSLHLPKEASLVEAAVAHAIGAGVHTADIGGKASTTAAGDAVLAHLRGN